MADLVDKAEAELSQIMARITMATMQRGLRLSATVGKGVALAPYKVAAAVWNVTSNAISKAAHPDQGKVSLRQFTQLTEGKRDVVKLDDKAVAREFERELKRHGVTWTVEQHRDGSRTFHVQGKDAELIQHALGVAAARVDEKIARGAPELQADQQPVEHEQPQQEQTPEHDGTEQEHEVSDPRLIEHGHAPYQHEDGASESYFVTIDQGGVQQTLWGVDLERAIDVSGAQIGDGITLENVGSIPVTLPDGTKAHRNTWNVTVTDAQQTVTDAQQPEVHEDHQVLDLDEGERSAVADELRKYADYSEGDLDLDTRELAGELSNDPTYAYDEQATSEALEQEQERIGQVQQEQVAAATPYRELADQVEQTGRLDLTDDAVRRDVTEVIDNAGWRLDGDAQDAPPQPMQRVVEVVQAPRQQEQPQHDQAPQRAAPERDEYDEPVQAESVGVHGTDELREDAPARSSAEDATPEHDQPAATAERDEAVADRGGHSQQREAPAPVADRPPRQLSPRDETREKVAKRIDQDVKAKKEELRQSKTRTRTPGRDAATEAREATRRR